MECVENPPPSRPTPSCMHPLFFYFLFFYKGRKEKREKCYCSFGHHLLISPPPFVPLAFHPSPFHTRCLSFLEYLDIQRRRRKHPPRWMTNQPLHSEIFADFHVLIIPFWPLSIVWPEHPAFFSSDSCPPLYSNTWRIASGQYQRRKSTRNATL